MSIQNNNPTDPMVNASEIKEQPAYKAKQPRNYKMIVVGILGIIVLLLLMASGYYFFIYDGGITDTDETNAAVFLPEVDEIDYYNETYKFKMITKKNWNINEFGTKVEFNVDDDGKIYFEAFNDSEFANIKVIDERFCDSFEEGFKEGLAGNDFADKFDFKLFTQNELNGCEAEGEIIEGFRQRYNVFYNPTDKLIYSIFYTSSNPESEEALAETLRTFRIAE